MDLFIFQQINQFALRWFWLDVLTIFFAKYFGYILVFLLLLFLVKNFKKYRQMVTLSFLSAILARFIIVDTIRLFWERPRPFVDNHINLLLDRLNQSAFPSGHAAFFFAIATIIYFYNKKAGLLFFMASFLITIPRIFTGVHWSSDILAGAIVGILSALLIILSFRKFSLIVKKY